MVPVLPSWSSKVKYSESFKKRNRKSDSVFVAEDKIDDFPHKYKIQAFLGLQFLLLLLITVTFVYFMSSNSEYRPQEFYDPCGAQNVSSVNEMIKMKVDLDKLTKKIEILTNDLPPEVKPAVSPKLKELSQDQQKLDGKIKYQIHHRTICYQTNVQRHLETNDSQQQIIDIIYISLQIILLTLLWYYIFKICKFKFSSRQSNFYKLYISFAIILLIIHVIFGTFLIKSNNSQSTFDKNRIKVIPDF